MIQQPGQEEVPIHFLRSQSSLRGPGGQKGHAWPPQTVSSQHPALHPTASRGRRTPPFKSRMAHVSVPSEGVQLILSEVISSGTSEEAPPWLQDCVGWHQCEENTPLRAPQWLRRGLGRHLSQRIFFRACLFWTSPMWIIFCFFR